MNKSVRLLGNMIAAILLLGVSGISNAEVLHKSVNKGFAAYFSAFIADGVIYGNIIQSGLGDTKKTTLYYYIESYSSKEHKTWSGVIPNTAFSGAGTSRINVNYNTCDVNPTSSCGVFNVTWNANNIASTYESGISRDKFGNIMVLKTGSSTFNSADVSGSVLGTDLSTASWFSMVYMGTEHNMTHTVSRGSN